MTEVLFTGALFTGAASGALDRACIHVENLVGQEAWRTVHHHLSRSLRNPTGFYESQVVVDRAMGGSRVHDSGVIYGPWLEGVGSRNRTTRFKGYASFRKAHQDVNGRAAQLAQPAIDAFIREVS